MGNYCRYNNDSIKNQNNETINRLNNIPDCKFDFIEEDDDLLNHKPSQTDTVKINPALPNNIKKEL